MMDDAGKFFDDIGKKFAKFFDDIGKNFASIFSSKEDKVLFQKQLQQHLQSQHHGGDYDGDNTTYHTSTSTSITVQSYAFTFQAHPEYISPTGFNVDYINTVNQIIRLIDRAR